MLRFKTKERDIYNTSGCSISTWELCILRVRKGRKKPKSVPGHIIEATFKYRTQAVRSYPNLIIRLSIRLLTIFKGHTVGHI